MNERVEGVVLEVAHDDFLDRAVEVSITLRSRSCVIGRGGATFSICGAMALASKTPDPDRQHPLAVLVAQDDDGHVRDGSTSAP